MPKLIRAQRVALLKEKGARARGFTLIELAIVLVVIGLIISAVTVGKDVLRGAEFQKGYRQFIEPWIEASYIFYERTKQVPELCEAGNGVEGVANGCVLTMQNIGITLPAKYSVSNDAGELQMLIIAEIEDDRNADADFANDDCDAAFINGSAAVPPTPPTREGMILCFTTPQSVAFQIDKNLDDSTLGGLGGADGDVRWVEQVATAMNADSTSNLTGGDQIVTLSVRLGDIPASNANAGIP